MHDLPAVIVKIKTFLSDRSRRQDKWAEWGIKSITDAFLAIHVFLFSISLSKRNSKMCPDISWFVFLPYCTLTETAVSVHVIQGRPDIYRFHHLPMHLKDQCFITIDSVGNKMGIFVKYCLQVSLAAIR